MNRFLGWFLKEKKEAPAVEVAVEAEKTPVSVWPKTKTVICEIKNPFFYFDDKGNRQVWGRGSAVFCILAFSGPSKSYVEMRRRQVLSEAQIIEKIASGHLVVVKGEDTVPELVATHKQPSVRLDRTGIGRGFIPQAYLSPADEAWLKRVLKK